MTDGDALSKVQGAFEEVKKETGGDVHAIREGLRKRRARDPTLFEAFKRVGQMLELTQQGH